MLVSLSILVLFFGVSVRASRGPICSLARPRRLGLALLFNGAYARKPTPLEPALRGRIQAMVKDGCSASRLCTATLRPKQSHPRPPVSSCFLALVSKLHCNASSHLPPSCPDLRPPPAPFPKFPPVFSSLFSSAFARESMTSHVAGAVQGRFSVKANFSLVLEIDAAMTGIWCQIKFLSLFGRYLTGTPNLAGEHLFFFLPVLMRRSPPYAV